MNLEVKTIIDCCINTFRTVSVSPRPLPRLAATWITLETPSRWVAILFDAISSTPTISNWAPYLANADFAISILGPRAVLISDFKFRIVGHKLNTSRQLPTLEHDNHFPTIGEQHGPLDNRLHLWPNEKFSAFKAQESFKKITKMSSDTMLTWETRGMNVQNKKSQTNHLYADTL